MNKFQRIVLAALVMALAQALSGPTTAADFADVLDSPAIQSEKAAHALFTGLAEAGSRLVAVGQRGHILFSDDAGLHWRQARVPVSSDLTSVHFPNPSQGWAVGHDGVVLYSSDAGETWTRQFDGRQVGQRMLERYQPFAAAHPEDQVLVALVNDAVRMKEEGADKPFLDLWFENERTGYIVGAFNLIFRTDDGGRSWIPWGDRVDNPNALNLYAIRRVGEDLFVAGEQGLLLKLDPVAGRFVQVSTPYGGTYFGVTGKPGAILVFGLRGNVYRSVDGGVSWSKVEFGLQQSITASTVAADGRIFLFSQAGDALVSADDGKSFQPLPNKVLTPVAAALASDSGALVVAGPRGLRQLPLE
ncbi:WD40/YVTN/BNR-like repeat-containing protein [Pseudomonas japonica]|uniref:Photosynthesis system II assembly factor Ycf48/Hcf136-like domain-containing protein n=1 Tax=Pseudomonas japonica TaxID=256466 RepID=A0A239AAM0_9PSED|nr:YCF48-related protein [Pseudomonas japonica]SNR92074.1 Uncharacterized protein SAMN05444352_101283 [Pseudomonas japonica]